MMPLLEARGVSKTYPGGIRALDHVDFDVREGEIHALLGENGAGKSTLAKILYGLVYPDEGTIFYRGRRVVFSSPRDALRLGILYVPQYPSMPAGVSLSDLVSVYAEARGSGSVRDVLDAAERMGWGLDPRVDVGLLSLVDRQRLTLALGLGLGFKVLLLDEPTSFLSGPEIERVLESVKRLKDEGLSIVYITHRVEEVLRVADRATILRRGRVSARLDRLEGVDASSLIRYIVGEALPVEHAGVERGSRTLGSYALRVEGLAVRGEDGRLVVDNVGLSVRRGEIVAIVGIEGMGQRELLEAIAGVRPRVSGYVEVCGKRVDSVKGFRRAGGRYIHGDRLEALALNMSLAENVIAPSHAMTEVCKGFVLSRRLVEALALRVIRGLSIRGDVWSPVASLSGGNQQKVMVGREVLIGDACLVVAHNPTAGLDIASARKLLELFAGLSSRGVGVLFATPSVDEALQVADRILVMRGGRITAEFERGVKREEVYHAIIV